MEKERKTRPTESQIEVVMSDWMGNLRMGEKGNFTHKAADGIARKERGGVSDYLIGDVDGMDELRLIKKARQVSEHVVNAICHEPVRISVGGRDSMHGIVGGVHHIGIATDYFDDDALTPRQKVDIMLGLATHEASHAAYTDPAGKEEHLKDEKGAVQELKKDIWNIIEDERIEYLLGEDCPGFVECLGETKRYYFKELSKRIRKNGKKPTEPLARFLDTLVQSVRYASELTREEVEENFDELDAIRRILTPYPLTPEGAWEATDRVMDIIRKMAEEKAAEDKQQQRDRQERAQQQAGASGSGQGQSSSPGSQDQQDGQDDGKDGKDSKDGKPKGKGPAKAKPTKAEIEKALSEMLESAETKGILSAISQDNDKSDPDQRCSAMNSEHCRDFANQDDAEIAAGGRGDPSTFVFMPKGDADSYLRSKRRVNAYIPAMAKALSCKCGDRDYVLQGMPSGKLNTNKLVSFRTGNRNIFTKQGHTVSSTASVIMLIDESGSMDGIKCQSARDAAVLVNEAVSRIKGVSFYCYGYTSNEINVYSEPGRSSKWALGGTAAKGGTPTGLAMKITADRVRKTDQSPCLMLVLTDGCADNSMNVMTQVKQLPKRKIYPIGVGIRTSAVSGTFPEHVVLDDMKEFAFTLGKLTRGRLDKMLTRYESED